MGYAASLLCPLAATDLILFYQYLCCFAAETCILEMEKSEVTRFECHWSVLIVRSMALGQYLELLHCSTDQGVFGARCYSVAYSMEPPLSTIHNDC